MVHSFRYPSLTGQNTRQDRKKLLEGSILQFLFQPGFAYVCVFFVAILPIVCSICVIATPGICDDKQAFSRFMLSGWLGWLTVFGLVQLNLPDWWKNYFELQTISQGLIEKKLESPSQLFGMGIAPFARAILPQSKTRDLTKATLSQLQSTSREIIDIAKTEFGKIVILIDDVDILPDDQFNEVMRVIRPFSKTSRLTCLISVPKYFYYVFQLNDPNDLHSTVRDVLVVGNPRIDAAAPYLSGQSSKAAENHRMLLELLQSRCRLPLKYDAIKELAENLLFQFVLGVSDNVDETHKLWSDWNSVVVQGNHTYDKNRAGSLERTGWGTRREWIREIARILHGEKPMNLRHTHQQDKIRERLLDEKASFRDQIQCLEPDHPMKNGHPVEVEDNK